MALFLGLLPFVVKGRHDDAEMYKEIDPSNKENPSLLEGTADLESKSLKL